MANEQNLTHPPIQSGEEAAKKGRAGGIASGRSRRMHKTMREWAKYLAKCPVEIRTPDGVTLPGDLAGQIIIAQCHKAAKGDTKAAKFVADLLGEVQETGTVINLQVNARDKDGADRIAKLMEGDD